MRCGQNPPGSLRGGLGEVNVGAVDRSGHCMGEAGVICTGGRQAVM